jgi:hypothetical protein
VAKSAIKKHLHSVQLSAWVVVSLLLLSGCGKGGRPEVQYTFHPVKGRVTQGNGSPVGGEVRFMPRTDPNYVSIGTIGSDGSYTLNTTVYHKTHTGAPAGEYAVTLRPTGSGGPVPVMGTYTVKEGDNDIPITVGGLGPLEIPPNNPPPPR